MAPWVIRLVVGSVVAASLMVALWLRQRATKNAGIVDVGWTAAIGFLGVAYALLGSGYLPRRIIVALMVGLWSLRLTSYLFRRVFGEPEDGRYAKLRQEWGPQFDRKLFWFYQSQAAAVMVFVLPAFIAAENPIAPLGWLDALGIALWITGVIGVAASDAQLARFRAKPENRGKTCRDGLWGVSRHPNYFFECLVWWSYVPIAHGAPAWWVVALVAMLMMYVVTCVTGIPVTEANAIASRGDDYRQYQRTVSAFIPWFPKRTPAPHNPAAHHEPH